MASREHQVRPIVGGSDEIGALSEAVNQMAVELRQRMDNTLRQRNEMEAVLASMVEGVIAVDDSGRVVNRKTFDCQVFGGMTMGLGYGLTEKRVMDRKTGKMCNTNLHDYKVPGAMDVPVDHEVVPIDLNDTECNNVGCKGLGEPSHVPTAAAIANAVYDAIGVRPTDGPIDNKMILDLLGRKKGA